jgi:hypothetical protein
LVLELELNTLPYILGRREYTFRLFAALFHIKLRLEQECQI